MHQFDFNRLIPDLQLEILKKCEIKELAAVASSSRRCKDLTKNELLWQQLYQFTFGQNFKTQNTWYETYSNRKWALKLLSLSGREKLIRLKTIDPQTWHPGAARKVQSCVQPIIVTPFEFTQIPQDLIEQNRHILYENNYYFVPLGEERFKSLRVIIRLNRAYPSLSRH